MPLDWFGHENGNGRGNAYSDADRISRRDYGTEMSQDLVDDIHLGSRDDFLDGTSSINQRRPREYVAAIIYWIHPEDGRDKYSHQTLPNYCRNKQQ